MRENAGSALDGTWDGFWQWIPDSAWPSIVLHVQFQTLEQKNRFDRYNFNSYIMEHCDRYPNTLGKSPTAIFEKGLQGLNTSPLASSKEHFGDIVTQTFNFYGSPKYPPTPFLASEFIGDHDVGLNFPFWRQKEKWSQGSITGVSSSTATGVGSSYPHIPTWTMLNRTSGESSNNTVPDAPKYKAATYPCNWVELIQDSALHYNLCKICGKEAHTTGAPTFPVPKDANYFFGCGHYSSCTVDDPNWDCIYQNVCPSEDAGTNDKPSSFPPPHSPPLSPVNECYPRGEGTGLFPLPWINSTLIIKDGHPFSPICPKDWKDADPSTTAPYDSYIFPPWV